MAIRTINEIMNSVKERIGDNSNDDDLSFVEDISDTLKSFSESESTITELRAENESLRKKYRDRFFSGNKKDDDDDDDDDGNDQDTHKCVTFDDLFKEV